MSIDWKLELEEYLHPNFIKGHVQVAADSFKITTLEGHIIEILCSLQGF